MADISKIRLPGEELAYDLKDGFAREAYASLSAQLSGYYRKNEVDAALSNKSAVMFVDWE